MGKLSETFRSLTKILIFRIVFIRTTEKRHHQSVVKYGRLVTQISIWINIAVVISFLEAFYDEDEME